MLKLQPKESTSKKKLTPSTYKKQKKKKGYTKQPLSHLHLIQLVNPTKIGVLDSNELFQSKTPKIEGPFSKDNLVSDQSKNRNKYFSFYMDKKSYLKTILFLVFQLCPKQAKKELLAKLSFFSCQKKHISNPKASPTLSLTSSKWRQRKKKVTPKVLSFCYC